MEPAGTPWFDSACRTTAGCRSSRGDSSIASKTKPAAEATGVSCMCGAGCLTRWPPAGRLVAVIPPLQGRLIIVARRCSIAGCVSPRSASQTGLVAVLVIDHLPPVFERCQPRFDVVEFRRSHGVLEPSWKDMLNLFLGLGDPVGRLGMGGKSLGERSRLLLFHGLQFLEEGNERLRVVSRLVHILQAQVIGLRLERALEA